MLSLVQEGSLSKDPSGHIAKNLDMKNLVENVMRFLTGQLSCPYILRTHVTYMGTHRIINYQVYHCEEHLQVARTSKVVNFAQTGPIEIYIDSLKLSRKPKTIFNFDKRERSIKFGLKSHI